MRKVLFFLWRYLSEFSSSLFDHPAKYLSICLVGQIISITYNIAISRPASTGFACAVRLVLGIRNADKIIDTVKKSKL